MSMRLIVGAITILVLALPAYAIRLKGKLPSGVSSATALSVLSGDETQTTSIDEDSNSKFSLEVGGVDARLVLSQSNTTLPVLIAIQTNNGKIISVKKAKKQGICGESGTVGLTAFKKSISGRKSLRLKVEEISGTPAWVSVNNIKGFRGKAKFNKRGAKRVASKTHAAEINSDCSLKGNASNFGLSATVSGASVGTRLSEQDGDTDGDGNPNQTDIDHDDDGVLNNYDSNFTASSDSFRIFTNLKTGLENTLNSNIATVSDSEKTALLQSTQSMAIEVKAQTGETAELFCGPSSSGLEYCRPGGTGVISGSTTAFPDDVNSDGDDGGTITAGDTGDFQLLTKVTSKDNIGSGDSLTQVVTDADGNETRYLTNLQFAFTEIPALQSLVLDPDGTATSLFTESSYPVASSGSGTMNNPFSVTANSDGNFILRIVSYGPGREGL